MRVLSGILYLIIITIISGCASTKKVPLDFEQVLYPDGRFFVIRHSNEIVGQRFESLIIEGNRLKMMGDFGNSISFYREALQIDSTCAVCYFEIGNLLIQKGDFESAEKYLFEAVKYDPGNEFYLLLLSRLYNENKKPELAIKAAKYLVHHFPRNPEYLYHLAQLQYSKGSYQEAISSLSAIESIVGVNETLSLEKVTVWSSANRHSRARRVLMDLSKAYPAYFTYQIFLGDFYLAQGKLRKAYNVFDRVRQEDPHNGYLYFSLANYYLQRGDTLAFRNAMSHGFAGKNVDLNTKIQRIVPLMGSIEQVDNPLEIDDINGFLTSLVELHPLEVEAHLLKAHFQKFLDNDSIALSHFETALLINQNQEEVWQDYLITGFPLLGEDEVLEKSTLAAKLFPGNSFLQYAAGFSHVLNELYHPASLFLLKASELSEDNSALQAQIYGLLGDVYFKLSNPDSSFIFYQKSLDINPDNIVVLNNYAYFLSVENTNLSKAEEMINKVISVEPYNPVYLDTYAWIMFKMGNFPRALEIIEKAIEHGGYDHGVILEHYGDILYKNGMKERALGYWIKASKTDDDISEVLYKKIETRTFIPCD